MLRVSDLKTELNRGRFVGQIGQGKVSRETLARLQRRAGICFRNSWCCCDRPFDPRLQDRFKGHHWWNPTQTWPGGVTLRVQFHTCFLTGKIHWMFPLQCLMLQRFYTDALFLRKHQLSHCEDSCCIVRVRTWKPMEYRRMLRRLETERLELCGEFRRRKVRWGWSGLTRTWRTMSLEGFLKASQIELCQICSINLTIVEKIVDFHGFSVCGNSFKHMALMPWLLSELCTEDKWIRCVLRFFCSSLQTTPSAVQIGIGGLSHPFAKQLRQDQGLSRCWMWPLPRIFKISGEIWKANMQAQCCKSENIWCEKGRNEVVQELFCWLEHIDMKKSKQLDSICAFSSTESSKLAKWNWSALWGSLVALPARDLLQLSVESCWLLWVLPQREAIRTLSAQVGKVRALKQRLLRVAEGNLGGWEPIFLLRKLLSTAKKPLKSWPFETFGAILQLSAAAGTN